MRLGQSIGLAAHQKKHVVPWSNAYSCDFDGSDDYVNCATGSDLDFIHTAATLSYWARYDTSFAGGVDTPLGNNASGKKFYVGLYYGQYAYAEVGDGSTYGAIPSGALSVGDWHHFALTCSGSTLTTFVDAVQCSTASYTNNASKNPTSNFLIGKANTHATGITIGQGINGQIDEVAIWNVALDADALTAIYNSGAPTDLTEDSGNYDNSANLYSYWRMGDNDGGTGSTITDQGSGANNGTIVNEATFSSNVPTA